MQIDDLIKKYYNSFPNHQLVKAYEAAVPQFCLNVILTFEQERALPLIDEYVMKFVRCGVNEISNISRCMGMNERIIMQAVGSLHEHNFISVSISNSEIKLTDKGLDALEKMVLLVRNDTEENVIVDSFTDDVSINSPRQFYRYNDISKHDIKALRPRHQMPKIEELNLIEIKQAVSRYKKLKGNTLKSLEGELVDIRDIKKSYTMYKKVSVLLFYNQSDGEIIPLVFDKATRSEEYEAAVLKSIHEDTRILEVDKIPEEENRLDDEFSKLIPKDIIKEAKKQKHKLELIDNSLTKIRNQVEEITQNTIEKDDNNEEILELKKRIKELEAEKENSEKHDDKIIDTYEHRPLLIRAFDESKNLIVIVSPWIKHSGLDDEIYDKIVRAINGGVEVVIGYGISKNDDKSDEKIINKLHSLENREYKGQLKLIALNNTHEKVLIMDNEFAVITSFNWLSFAGNPRYGFRRETGVYTEHQGIIEDLKNDLQKRMKIKFTICNE